MTIAKQSILEAARAYLAAEARLTRVYSSASIKEAGKNLRLAKNNLCQAIQDAEVYTPLTNAEHYQIWSADGKFLPISDWNLNDVWEDERAIERAVIERLGLRWPE